MGENMAKTKIKMFLLSFFHQIYICGGYDGNVVLQTAESYNPETNQWTVIAPMLSRRAGIGVVGHADQVYVVCTRKIHAHTFKIHF